MYSLILTVTQIRRRAFYPPCILHSLPSETSYLMRLRQDVSIGLDFFAIQIFLVLP